MRNLCWALAALALAAGSAAVQASPLEEPTSLVGKEAPEIQTKEWINGDGRTSIADFRGEVVLIEAWATW
jgi:hypothetical protein